VQEAAQILMDCVADIVDCHGLGPLRPMCQAMQLQRVPSAGTCLEEPCLASMLSAAAPRTRAPRTCSFLRVQDCAACCEQLNNQQA
jgi:hypothetical protein